MTSDERSPTRFDTAELNTLLRRMDTRLQTNELSTDDAVGTDCAVVSVYEKLFAVAQAVATQFREDVLRPVAKEQFKRDRGHDITKTLPDRTENYDFASHGFEALVLPDERSVVNIGYQNAALTPTYVLCNAADLAELIDQARRLWLDTFGEWAQTQHQPGHPGPFPLADHESPSLGIVLADGYAYLQDSATLDLVVGLARDQEFRILADLFDTSRSDILTPGGTDLSALRDADGIHVPYNDGTLAVLRPTGTRSRGAATRGAVIGHDDTPTGLFCHVIDVTNLHHSQHTTRAAIRDAMGFDREIDPDEPPRRLAPEPGEQIRLQGDLRVERTDDVEGFPDEIARDVRLSESRALVDAALEDITVPDGFVRGTHRSSLAVRDILDITVSETGTVAVESSVRDSDVHLLALATALVELSVGPAGRFAQYGEIPGVSSLTVRTVSLAAQSMDHALSTTTQLLSETLEAELEANADRIEQAARTRAADAEVGIDVPKQVNLPIDNHMTFIEAGFAHNVDQEPVPVAVPDETTLHIVHDEHNTVTVQIPAGVYRFSLLPRGLQPPSERPEWPTA
jgi:hypothetical protein